MANLLRISESASLAVHGLAVLALDPERRRTGPALAEIFGASANTMAKVLQGLHRAGLVESVRGPRGGFRLARDPREITLLEIYEAVEGPVETEGCLLGNPVCDQRPCLLGGMIRRVQAEIRETYAGTTLAELAAGVPLTVG
jgi:Rrf2 family protein